jgi:hypothetical protein
LCVAVEADETFDVRLSPAPRDASMKEAIAGHGTVRVALQGSRLTLTGRFAGFPSPATRAALRRGAAVALRGPAIRELTVSSGTSGTLTADLTLDAKELAALEAGQLYIEIATALAPDGNVWGWLLPAAAPVVRDR